MEPPAIKPTPTGKPYRQCPLYPDLAFSPTGLFTPDQCVPIDPFLKVTDMPHEASFQRLQEWEQNSMWMLDLATNVPDLLQQGFMYFAGRTDIYSLCEVLK